MTSKSKSLKFDVVGLNHRLIPQQQQMLAALTEGNATLQCEIEREPRNPADENAVKVILTDQRAQEHSPRHFASKRLHIGYIRRDTAKVLAPGLDEGTLVVESCKLVQVDPTHGVGKVRLRFLKKPASKRKIGT